MKGGEIFIPKIPSIRIVDLAKAMNKKKKIYFIGIRPGEKLHEAMTTQDENNQLIEFKNYFLHFPPYLKNAKEISKYKIGASKEKGKIVDPKFSYTSDRNKFLSIEEIKNFIQNQKT